MFIFRFLSQVYICSLLHFENTGPKNSSVHFLIAFFSVTPTIQSQF